MRAERSTRFALRVSAALASHRIVAFVISAGVLLLMAGAIRRVLPAETRVSVFTWILVALMAYAVVAVVLMWKRSPADRRLFFVWGIGLSPAVYGFAAALTGSPAPVMWLGILLSVCLVAAALAIAPRTPNKAS